VVSALLSGLAQLLHLALVLAAAPVLAGCVAWLEARMAGRAGPSPLQPWRDLRRALGQMPVLGEGASWLVRAAPGLRVAALAVAAALVPGFTMHMALAPAADLVVVLGLIGLARALGVLAALDEGTAEAGQAAVAMAARAAMGLPALLAVAAALALAAGDTSLPVILELPYDEAPGLLPALLPLGLALVLVAGSEGAAPVGGLSGRHLALHGAAEALRLMVWLGLVAALVLPPGLPAGRDDPAATVGDWLMFLPVWLAKLGLLALGVAALRVLLPRRTARQAAALAGLAGLLALLGLALLLAGQGMRGAWGA
jgi:formate hydrogenlyase subunit 4